MIIIKITITLLVLLLFSGSGTAVAGEKIILHEVDQPFSGSQSPDDAYIAAVTRAKFEVLEMAGTYLESLTVVENAILTRDEVTALAAGIMKTEVIDVKNYATEKIFGMVLSTRISVNTDVLNRRMEKLLLDRTLLQKYSEIQQREQELLNRIKQLEQQLTSGPPAGFHDKFSEISAALSASEWTKKALTLWTNGHFSSPTKAVEYLTHALELDPKNPRSFNSRAIAYLNLQQNQKAEQDLEQAIRLNPKYSDAYNNLGSLHYQRGEYEAAIVNYTQALQFQPDFVEAILNRGMASRKLFNFADAFEDFNQAIQLAPHSFSRENDAGSLVELNDIKNMCNKAQTACNMQLCRSLTFLQQRGFCLGQ